MGSLIYEKYARGVPKNLLWRASKCKLLEHAGAHECARESRDEASDNRSQEVKRDNDDRERREDIAFHGAAEPVIRDRERLGEDSAQYFGAIKRRDRNEIDDRKENVDDDHRSRKTDERIRKQSSGETDEETEDNREEKVDRGTGTGDQRLSKAGIAQIVRIIRNRFRPTEQKRGIREKHESRQNDGAEQVEMRQRVEREPPRQTRRGDRKSVVYGK